jgi:hypothetical protein
MVDSELISCFTMDKIRTLQALLKIAGNLLARNAELQAVRHMEENINQ